MAEVDVVAATSSPAASNDSHDHEQDHRPDSPSPSVSPSMALDAVPQLDHRSVSTPSSTTGSTLSSRSRQSRLSEGAATVVRRRGYMRPQGTSFADSARNRDSVMSLGSIAHMQYYFARTGLLDGKGAQLAKEGRKKDKENIEPAMTRNAYYNIPPSSLVFDGQNTSTYAISDPGVESAIVESPTDMHFNTEAWDPSDPIMLPPTVSTYKVKPEYIEPLPDMPVLRRELKEALQDACKVLEETQKQDNQVEESSGYHEIQGMHLLDIITLAIRAAKNYYTAHENPQKLYAIKSEKIIRSDLYHVLDVLKRMASRNFRGGIRLTELTEILLWIESIDKLIKQEEVIEQQEAAERESWVWREGDWTGRERERECLFMRSFDQTEPALPTWPEEPTNTLPNDFLRTLQDGQRLVKLHNTLVSRSQRRFHEIKTWHTDVGKPYRMADNLRYWVKAAELRWDIVLDVPVLDVVNGNDEVAWGKFGDAVLKWCRGVRRELMEEWRLEKIVLERRRPPEVKVESVEGGKEDAVEGAALLDAQPAAAQSEVAGEAPLATSTVADIEAKNEAPPALEPAVDSQPSAADIEVKAEAPVALKFTIDEQPALSPAADIETKIDVPAATQEPTIDSQPAPSTAADMEPKVDLAAAPPAPSTEANVPATEKHTPPAELVETQAVA